MSRTPPCPCRPGDPGDDYLTLDQVVDLVGEEDARVLARHADHFHDGRPVFAADRLTDLVQLHLGGRP